MSSPWSPGRPPADPADPASRGWRGGRRPRGRLGLRGALVLLVLWMIISGLGFWPGAAGGLGVAPVPQALAAVFLLICVGLFRWSDTAMGPPRSGPWYLLWLPSLYLTAFAALIVLNGAPGPDVLLALAVAMIWLALSEELMFRGLLFPALRGRMGIWPAIWLTTVLFGLAHVVNIAATGSAMAALVQSIAAISTGLLLLAIRLRRGSIWPAVVYHLLWNVGVIGLELGYRAPGAPPTTADDPGLLLGVIAPLMLVMPNGLYGLWLMRHAARDRLPGDPERVPQA
jgi:uncharacterized protein